MKYFIFILLLTSISANADSGFSLNFGLTQNMARQIAVEYDSKYVRVGYQKTLEKLLVNEHGTPTHFTEESDSTYALVGYGPIKAGAIHRQASEYSGYSDNHLMADVRLVQTRPVYVAVQYVQDADTFGEDELSIKIGFNF